MARKIIPLPPTERLRALFIYDPLTGAWDHRIGRGNTIAGTPAGSWLIGRHGEPRRRCSVEGVYYYTARLIWKLVHGVDPTYTVDHIDRDTTNERLDNLRDISQSDQERNKRVIGVSGYRGVRPKRKRWAAHAHLNPNRNVHLGTFDTTEEAARKRDSFVKDILWNPTLNFPKGE